jgi:C4-dicarboxylate transporter DctQ subunit
MIMKLFAVLSKIIEKICAVLMIVMTIITFIQVVRRYVFQGAYVWAEASVLLSMLWVAFLGSVVAISKGQHTRLDFAINLLPPLWKKLVETLGDLICATATFFLAYHSLSVIRITSRQISFELGVPRSVYTSAVLVGGCAMALFFLVSAVNRWVSAREVQ